MTVFVPKSPLRLVVLTSGGGTTLRNLIKHIADDQLDAAIQLVISSNPAAAGLVFAKEAGIPTAILQRSDFRTTTDYSHALFELCREAKPDIVVMGGFLKLLVIPDDFQHRVVNIHPGLVPSFAGRGYYGQRVHEAVLAYGAKLTGCTVHFVDDEYDHGPIILQKAVPVLDDDTPQALAARVFAAECEAYPEALRLLGEGKVSVEGRRVRIRQ